MNLGPTTRRVLVFGSLALTLAAVKWVDGKDERSSAPAGTRPTVRAAKPAVPPTPSTVVSDAAAPPVELDVSRVVRTRGGKVADAFAPRNWQPAPSPAAIREMQAREILPPPPPPQAPPLPFTYVGRLTEPDRTTVFLSTGSRDIAAAVGETIDGTYRVDAVTATRVELTYLPLDQRQSLTLRTP